MKRTLLTLTAVALISASTAFANQPTTSLEPTNYSIFKDVSSQVRNYTSFTVFDNVTASVDDGIVILSGKVTMPFKRNDIERRVTRVAGVKQVVNQIDVLPVSQFDEELRFRIARAIYGNPNFWHYASMANPPIHIVVEHGRVTLSGVVQNEVERMLARSLATSFGAFSVKNDLKTDAEMDAVLETLK
ncbi:MAG: BON domain-containing protein [Acidobacteria bacterium]|nr:BON domain-containing protein [Acidobacteriota bacterium]